MLSFTNQQLGLVKLLNKYKLPLLVSGIALLAYFIWFSVINLNIGESVMFSSVDARSYLSVADWIQHNTASPYIAVRPVLYPTLIILSRSIGGYHGIWLMQVLFWVVTANFTFFSVLKLTNKKVLSFVALAIFISNVSLVSLTLHGLSEITTALLLSILVYCTILNRKHLLEVKFIHTVVLLLGLLTIVRPLFLLPLLGILCLLPVLHLKKYFQKPIKLTWLALALLPVLIQGTIIKLEYNEFGISTRSSDTVDFYLMAQSMHQIENIEVNEARAIITEMNQDERWQYKMDHLGKMTSNLFQNVENNIKADAIYLASAGGNENLGLRNYMKGVNLCFFILHYIFLAGLIVYTVYLFRKKQWFELAFLWFLTLLAMYYIVASGVSFWQGDRLVLPAMVVWLCSYFYLAHSYSIWLKKDAKALETQT